MLGTRQEVCAGPLPPGHPGTGLLLKIKGFAYRDSMLLLPPAELGIGVRRKWGEIKS